MPKPPFPHSHLVRAVLLACLTSAIPVQPARADNLTTAWDGTTGDWFDAARWTNGIPINSTDLYLPLINAGSVTLTGAATTSGLILGRPALLTLTSGSTYTIAHSFSGSSSVSGMIALQSSAVLNVTDNITLNNATISGDGTFRLLSGLLTVSGTNPIQNFYFGDQAAIQGFGELDITGQAVFANFQSISATGSLAVVLQPTSTLLLNSSALTLTFPGSLVIKGNVDFRGTSTYIDPFVINTAGNVTVGADGLFANASIGTLTCTGTVALTSGTLSLRNANLSGPIHLSANSTLVIGSGTLNVSALTNDGGSLIITSTLTFSGAWTTDHLSFASLNNTSGSLTLINNNSWSTGNVSIRQLTNAAGATLLTTGFETLNSGTITNNGTFLLGFWPDANQTFASNLLLQSGTRFLNNGVLALDSTLFSNGGTLTNSGTITLANPASTTSHSAVVPLVNNGTVSGVFALGNVTSSGMIAGTNTLTSLNNSGLFTGAGSVTGNTFNTGTISGNITLATGSSSGLITADSAAANATLKITGAYTLTNGARISSTSGTVSATGTLTILGQVNADHLLFGSMTNSGTLNLSGPNTWTGGTLTNSTSISPPNVHLLPNSILTLGTTSSNASLMLANGQLLNDSLITSQTAGNLSVTLNDSFLSNAGTLSLPLGGILSQGSGSLSNSGQILSAGNTSIRAPFSNSGTLTSLGGSLTISSNTLGLSSSATGAFIASSTASTITFSSTPTFLLSNASLSGPGVFTGAVQVAGSVTVTNAAFTAISGTGTLDVAGTLNLQPPGSSGISITNAQVRLLPSASLFGFSGFTLTNAAFVIQGTGGSLANTITFAGSSTLTNQGALTPAFGNLTFNQSLSNPGVSQFSNPGLFNVTNGNFTCNIPFFNSGTVTVGNNTALITAGGVGSGTFITTGFQGINFGSGYTLSGATLKELTPSSLVGLQIAGTIKLLNQNTADFFAIISNTSVAGPGTLTVSNVLSLMGNSTLPSVTSGAHLIVPPSGTLVLARASSFPASIDAASVLNLGVLTFAGGGNPSILKLTNGGTLTNAGTANNDGLVPFSIDSDANTQNAFINTGIMTFSQSSGSIGLAAPFYNEGTLSVVFPKTQFPTGPLFRIAGGGSASGLFHSTTINGITFTAPYTLDNATVSGNIVAAALLTLRNHVQSYGLSINAGLAGPGTLAGGAILWSAGTVSNAGGVLVNGTASALAYFGTDASDTIAANLAILSSNPTANRTLAASTITIAQGATAAWGNASATTTFTSDQIPLASGAQIMNNGSFYSYIAQPSFNSDNHSANAFINAGTFGRSSLTLPGPSPSANTTTFHVPFHNTGTLDIQQGFIDFAAGYFDDNPITDASSKFHFAPGAGLYFSGGDYDFGNAPFDLGQGGLAGTGTVHANFISSGTISPGNSPGTLTIDGNLALRPGASLNLEISYAGSSPAFDALNVLGNFSAAGALNLIILVGGGTPDDTPLPFITASSFTGTFDNLPNNSRLLDSAGDGTYLLTYTPTGLMLSDFQPAPVPEPTSLALLLPSLLLLRRKRKSNIASSHPPVYSARHLPLQRTQCSSAASSSFLSSSSSSTTPAKISSTTANNAKSPSLNNSSTEPSASSSPACSSRPSSATPNSCSLLSASSSSLAAPMNTSSTAASPAMSPTSTPKNTSHS